MGSRRGIYDKVGSRQAGRKNGVREGYQGMISTRRRQGKVSLLCMQIVMKGSEEIMKESEEIAIWMWKWKLQTKCCEMDDENSL